jgi:hypothetical protein
VAKGAKAEEPEIDCADLLKSLDIRLQPKQQLFYDKLTAIGNVPTVLGMGGSRGSAKSGGIRRIAITLACTYEQVRVFIVRRVLGDLLLNHVAEMALEYPAIHELYHPPSGGKRPEYRFPNGSLVILIYAETNADIDRLVKGQQAAFVLIDQAEQFTEAELIAFREVNRAPGVPKGYCKIGYFFNTAQGVGAAYFRRIFHTKRWRENENPGAYDFIQAYGWDNYEWFRGQTPYSFEDFYQLSSEDRFAVYIRDTSQGRKQNELSERKRDADLLGSFDSDGGLYFSDVWGEHCELDAQITDSLMQPWWTRWMAMRWGFGDHACHLWAATGLVTPAIWKRTFGGTIPAPVECVIIYRELLALGRAEADLANDIVSMTPESERRGISSFWMGSSSLDQQKKRGENTVGETLGKILRRYGLPDPIPADDRRVDGWRFVYACLRQAGLRQKAEIDAKALQEGPALFISTSCPLCIEHIPLAPPAKKDPNDIEIMAEEWASITDAVRFLLKSKPSAKAQAPLAIRRQMALEAHTDPTAKHMAALRFQQTETGSSGSRPNWRH